MESSRPDVYDLLEDRRQIALVWSIGDVRQVRPDLNDDQCWEVLKLVNRRHDASIGVNWFTLEDAADELYESPPEETRRQVP